MRTDIVNYLIEFLLYGSTTLAQRIGYTANRDEWKNYRLVIIPAAETRLSSNEIAKKVAETGSTDDLYLPDFDLRPTAERYKWGEGDEDLTFVVSQDILYNTFFLVTRAEELLNHQRDEHGRFLAKYSSRSQHNQLLIPIVDEYARFMVKTLSMTPPKARLNSIFLTHDVDILTRYRTLHEAVGGILHGNTKTVIKSLFKRENDPAWTLPWLLETDQQALDRMDTDSKKIIYFIKNNFYSSFDRPHYNALDFKAFDELLRNRENVYCGIHTSYYSGAHFDKIKKELPETKTPLLFNRTHYLRSTEPSHLTALAEAGITDDFTMAFADHIGFRLGTTRNIRWIDPQRMEITSMNLYPLTIMDCTLSDEKYMNLEEDEAFYLCGQMIDKVRMHGGDLTLLFHNHLLTPHSYHRQLYEEILEIL